MLYGSYDAHVAFLEHVALKAVQYVIAAPRDRRSEKHYFYLYLESLGFDEKLVGMTKSAFFRMYLEAGENMRTAHPWYEECPTIVDDLFFSLLADCNDWTYTQCRAFCQYPFEQMVALQFASQGAAFITMRICLRNMFNIMISRGSLSDYIFHKQFSQLQHLLLLRAVKHPFFALSPTQLEPCKQNPVLIKEYSSMWKPPPTKEELILNEEHK